ncbi:hypothetical protein [Companilactobacillus kedongensis]|uniref:hypothetical protein n=1 Tax=Companilactobacillus kedongensis TaxID=2486004 RepID=UPI0013DE736E|nr:hypothetical protein [Companilactobacillus kedongensis]
MNPFIICFGLIFVALVSNLSGEKFRINDLLITQSRKFITIAMIIRVISSQFIIWLLWTIPSLATVWISGLSYFVIGTHFQILLLYVYIYLAMLTLSLLELNLLMITNNTIAFLLAFGMNCLDYYLAKTTDDSLFYYFTNLKSQIDLATKFIIMLFLIGLLTFTLNKIISKKDF